MSPITNIIREWLIDLVVVGVILGVGYLSLLLLFGQIMFWFPFSWWLGWVVLFGLPILHQYLIKVRTKLK
jgi:hypothetical protein